MRRSIALLGAAVLLPVVVLSSAFWLAQLQSQQAAVDHLAREHAGFVSRLVDRELAANVRSVQMVAQSPAFDSGFDQERFRTLAARLLEDEASWIAISVSDPEGRRILDVPGPVGGRPNGRVVDMASLQATVRTLRPSVGSITRGPRGRAAFAVRAPVLRDGRLVYVVSTVMEPAAIARLLIHEGLPAEWSAEVVDANGNVAARTGARPELLGNPASAAARRARQAEPGFYRGASIDGEEEVAFWRPVGRAGWSVHVGVPAGAYGAAARQSALVLAIGSAVSLLLSGVVALLLLRETRQSRQRQAALADQQRLEALGRMTGGVAHDFNNLLTPIIGGLDMLRKRLGDDPSSSRILDAALQSAERARGLVARLLAFARRQTLQPANVDVRELVRGVAELVERSLGPDIRLDLDIDEATPPAAVDPQQLELAILNLALNARDAMPEGGVLTLATDGVDGGAGAGAALPRRRFARIRVIDTGEGMDPATLSRAVEPFFTTKAIGKGTGLGLSMVHGLAAQSGGGLFLSSEPGKGVVAEVWLPSVSSAPTPAAQTEPPVDGRTGTLLLVDDDEVVRLATAELLADHGHTVLQAASVNEAVRLLRADPRIEAVVTDFAMPGRSGAELVGEARAMRPGMPVLLITGYAGAADAVSADVPRLNKPFRSAELLNRVAQLLPPCEPREAAAS